jgi:DNA-binding NarL/FixJ family response regulator
MNKTVSIALVDDHTIVRHGLKSLIEVLGDFKISAQYDNGKDFVVNSYHIDDPDIVIMDLNMPEMDGMETTRWIRKYKPNLKVLILTLDEDEKTVIELFRMGVRGYLRKSCTEEELRKAINDIMTSGYYHSEISHNALLRNVAPNDAARPSHLLSLLNEREVTFLMLVCDKEEYKYDQIALKMKVSVRTIDGYRESLFRKLDLKSKTGLVLFAIKHGIVQL